MAGPSTEHAVPQLSPAKAKGFPPFHLAFWHCNVGISLKEWTLHIRLLRQTVRELVVTIQLQKWRCGLEGGSKALCVLRNTLLSTPVRKGDG